MFFKLDISLQLKRI